MVRSTGFLAQFEYTLADKLFHVPWFKRSARKQRLTMRLFQHAAEAGHVRALSVYGHLLFFRGATQLDKARGVDYLLRAAQAGDNKAQYQVGLIFSKGFGQYPQNHDQAITWLARAAEAGHVLAANRLAAAYRNGELGLGVDLAKAQHWEALADRLQPVAE